MIVMSVVQMGAPYNAIGLIRLSNKVVRLYNKTIFSKKLYFIFMANKSIDNNFKKYTYISVLSFKTFDRSCFSMYQLYF